MNSITNLIEKYKNLIQKETDYLASPEGQTATEDQRLFCTQKIIDWKEFVDELEKVNTETKSFEMPEMKIYGEKTITKVDPNEYTKF